MKQKGFWNLPNTLTVLRMALIPLVVALVWDEPSLLEGGLACFIFVAAMLTDIVDGWLARKWDLVSPMGAYLDPLADKLMVMAVLIMLIPLGWVPAWLTLLLLAREVAITGMRGIASQEGLTLSAGTMGKCKTAFQGSSLAMLLLPPQSKLFGVDFHSAGTILLWIATFFSLASALEYIILYYKASRRITQAA